MPGSSTVMGRVQSARGSAAVRILQRASPARFGCGPRRRGTALAFSC